MLSYIQAMYRGLAALLRHRVVLLVLMIAASYIAWGVLSTQPAAQAVTSSCAVNSDDYFSTLPNGFGTIIYQNASCQTCHTVEPTRGPFGSDYEAQTLKGFADGSFAHTWNSTLAFKDSDGDGYTNGEELQDPAGSWAFGTAAPGSAARVSSPNNSTQLPPAPALSALNGVAICSSYAGTLNLSVGLDTTVGARKVVYDILNGPAVVKSYTKTTSAAQNGGYTLSAATFNLAWDTNDVPNGTYTVRATLSDARAAGARTSAQAIANVTINNPSRTLRYVAMSGQDVGNCTNSATPCARIDYAVGIAQANDEIRVAEGLYTTGFGTSPLVIGTRVKLIGGYAAGNWTTPDPIAHPTKLDGQSARRVLVFSTGADGYTLQNVTIQHGMIADDGGAGIDAGVPGTISNVTFDSNNATGSIGFGGGLFLDTAATGTVIQNTRFLNNNAAQYGGAFASRSNFTASNVLFAKNAAQFGRAIALTTLTSAAFNYATIVGSGSGDAIHILPNTGPLTLNNTLISGYQVGATVNTGAVLSLNHVLMANDGANNVATPSAGAGTVNGAPIRGLAGYQNAAAGNYHLQFGAPAIDAGVAVGGVTTDLDGLARPFTTPLPNVVLTAPDIGAYEYSSPYGILYFLTANLNVTLPVQVAHIQVNLTVPSIRDVTVQYETQDVDAVDGVDYTGTKNTGPVQLTIPAGDAEVLFDIPIKVANLTTARSFMINLSNPTIAQLNIVSSMMVTINPPDLSGPPRVVLTASAPNASRNGPVPGVFTLTRDRGFDTDLTVNYTVGGSAVAGTDYAALPGSVTFQPGQTDVTIEVLPIGGSGDRLVTLTLTPDGAYLLGRSSATVGITGTVSHRIFLPMLRR